MSPLDLSCADFSVPALSRCFTVPRVISEELEEALLAWFESDAPWRLSVMDFYEQYEFDFRDLGPSRQTLKPLVSEDTLNELRRRIGGTSWCHAGASDRDHPHISSIGRKESGFTMTPGLKEKRSTFLSS